MNDQPKIIVTSVRDISDIHHEFEEFDYCYEVEFERPFEDEDEQERYEKYAMNELNAYEDVIIHPDDVEFDWRDEQELWMRYNITPSRIRDVLKEHGVSNELAQAYLDDIEAYSDIHDYDEMITTEIWVDYQRWDNGAAHEERKAWDANP